MNEHAAFIRIDRKPVSSWLKTFFVASFLLFTCYSYGSIAQDLIETVDYGCAINWTRGYVEAKGFHEAARNNPDDPFDFEEALQSAKLKARENLFRAAKSIRIREGSKVGEFASVDERIITKLSNIVENRAIVQQEYTSNGMVEVTVDLNLLGSFAQLVLPSDIEHVESIRSLNHHREAPVQVDVAGSGKKPIQEIFTGLIIDARGLGVNPMMAPRVLDENRQEVYGPAFVSREVAVQKGMCLYTKNILAARQNTRVLDNPLVVRALRTSNSTGNSNGSDLIISNSDALKIKSASEHLTFLRQCRVIIVVDPKEFPII